MTPWVRVVQGQFRYVLSCKLFFLNELQITARSNPQLCVLF